MICLEAGEDRPPWPPNGPLGSDPHQACTEAGDIIEATHVLRWDTGPAPAMLRRAPAASEQLADADRTRPVASGTFIHANPSDPVHYGRGKVSVYERAVFLEPDFEVGPGPAFHVYLVPKASIRSSADIKDVTFVDLGGLRSFKGSQRYAIPDGIDLRKYQSVIIWCERFGVLFASGPDHNRCRKVKT